MGEVAYDSRVYLETIHIGDFAEHQVALGSIYVALGSSHDLSYFRV